MLPQINEEVLWAIKVCETPLRTRLSGSASGVSLCTSMYNCTSIAPKSSVMHYRPSLDLQWVLFSVIHLGAFTYIWASVSHLVPHIWASVGPHLLTIWTTRIAGSYPAGEKASLMKVVVLFDQVMMVNGGDNCKRWQLLWYWYRRNEKDDDDDIPGMMMIWLWWRWRYLSCMLIMMNHHWWLMI